MASCPQGTYPNGTTCAPCYHECTMGCAGPLPYVNLTNGCLGCSYVQVDQQGQQVYTFLDLLHERLLLTVFSKLGGSLKHSTALRFVECCVKKSNQTVLNNIFINGWLYLVFHIALHQLHIEHCSMMSTEREGGGGGDYYGQSTP